MTNTRAAWAVGIAGALGCMCMADAAGLMAAIAAHDAHHPARSRL